MQQHLVLVPHTHWDREWYRTREEFRCRLVWLMDGLLDLLERDPDFRHFTLDGQTVVVDDYLEVRPAARERIERLVRAGRLLLGPWYVLPDEWLVSGEALVRNLRAGLARAAELGGSMRLGYVPDQFGHVGQLPQILAGFGLEGACLWRGVGADVERTLFWWEGRDGTRLLTLYLLQGYGNAAGLPLEPGALAERLGGIAASLAPHSPIPSLLLMNGSDHLPPQPGLPAALAAAAPKLDGARAEIGTLPGYFERARAEAPAALPLHRGELRSGLRAPLLVGCASARLPQKRADRANDRLLVRYLEPLSTWLGALGGRADPELLALAWRIALENHPHDSICGCSVDAVHDEMDVRFARVGQLGGGELGRVCRELGGQVAAGGGAGDVLVAWNPHAGGRGEALGEVELALAGAARRPLVHLRRSDGSRVPVDAEVVEPEAVLVQYPLPARVVAGLLRGFPEEFMGRFARGLRLTPRGVDVLMGSERLAGFDFAAARERAARRLAARGDAPVRYRAVALPRVRLRFADALPGHGLRVYRVARGAARVDAGLAAGAAGDGGAWIENAAWRIEVAGDGRVRCLHRASGTWLEDALRIVSQGDRGDEYNFDPVPDGIVVERPERVRVRSGPQPRGSACLRIDARYRVPRALAGDRHGRSRRTVALPVRILLRLLPDLDRIDVDVEVDNTARDHRLRLHLRAPFRAQAFAVESAFEVAPRPIAPAPDAFGPAQPAERPIGATPQRGFATLTGAGRALSVANRGSTEVEAVPEPDGHTSLAVTLLRAVGWLSRDDLALRPGQAGPPLETPGAQVPGLQRAELSLRLHEEGDPTRTLEAHRFAGPALLFGGAAAGAGPLHDGSRLLELDDPEVVVSAIEPARGGGALLRVYNASDRPRAPRLAWRAAEPASLRPVDPAGAPLAGEAAPARDGDAFRLSLRPWQILTLCVEPAPDRTAPAAPR